ncbi:probable asparagine--tRNA ligase, mitochondrial [Schistocerca piceifrons]|uniref:probable asparagine--tRNA ligase, mitochondrial n=1 Tax=Schistocerca piceifrons TaxID=274613 RepID=UPI001F5FCF65|nr:probable asparagine--tRNA ligase, mitochondrial [Schistocerca piceifrons]
MSVLLFNYLGRVYQTGACSNVVKNYIHHISRISDVLTSKPVDSSVTVQGWVKGLRKMKDLTFVDINDGSCVKRLQILIPTRDKPNQLAFGASVRASGLLKTNSKGDLELSASHIQVIGPCVFTDGYPFAARKSYPPDYVRQFLHLRSRTTTFGALLRMRGAVSHTVHKYFNKLGFLYIHTPILTANDCEGAGEVFLVMPESKTLREEMSKSGGSEEEAYFGSKVFLTVSGQLHLEAVLRGIGNVYCFGPTFRAENSRSGRHLSEFYMIEAELAFSDNLDDVSAAAEGLVRASAECLLAEHSDDIELLAGKERCRVLESVLNPDPFPKVMRSEAAVALGIDPDAPLSREHELEIVNRFGGGRPVFVYGAPASTAPFYAKQSSKPGEVESLELLAPIVGELVGGSIREDNPDVLQEKLLNLGLQESLAWYLDIRRFGSVPSGGFGLGFERLLQTLLNIHNIRDTVPFPRWPHNCKA